MHTPAALQPRGPCLTMASMSHTPFIRALFLSAALAGMATTALAQSDAMVTKRTSSLRESPTDQASTLAQLPAQTPLTRLPARQGAYVQVRTAQGASGWVHMFDLAAPAEQSSLAATATGALRGLSNLFGRGTAPASHSTAATTVGIRGLGAEDIANAQPNPAALAQMESQRQDASQARRFADSAALQVRQVEPLPVPAPPSPPPAPGRRNAEGSN